MALIAGTVAFSLDSEMPGDLTSLPSSLDLSQKAEKRSTFLFVSRTQVTDRSIPKLHPRESCWLLGSRTITSMPFIVETVTGGRSCNGE